MRIRPTGDQVLIRPDASIHARVHGAQVEDGKITSAVFGEVRVGNPVSYRVTGKLNQIAFGHVEAIGPGALFGQTRDAPPAAPGDVVLFDLGQVGTALPDGRYMLSWRNLLARLDPSDDYPQPCLNWVMSKQEAHLASRFVFRDSMLHSPGGAKLQGNDRARSRSRYVVDRAFRVGPGRYVQRAMQVAFESSPCAPGDAVLFYPFKSVDLAWRRGELFRFTEFSEVFGVVEGI